MACWHVGATREGAFHDSEDMLAGALDMYKCFDQKIPLLVEKLLSTLRGFPGRFWGRTGA